MNSTVGGVGSYVHTISKIGSSCDAYSRTLYQGETQLSLPLTQRTVDLGMVVCTRREFAPNARRARVDARTRPCGLRRTGLSVGRGRRRQLGSDVLVLVGALSSAVAVRAAGRFDRTSPESSETNIAGFVEQATARARRG